MFSWFPILFPLKVSSLVGTELNAKVEKWEWIDKSPCSFLPTATHLHIPGRWCHSAILALQQREEGLVWMGCDGALLLCHSQPRRPFLHHRPVKKTRRHKLADSCVSVRLCGSGRTGVVTLFTQLKTWTCASPWKSAVVGTLQFRKNGSDKPNLNLFLVFKSRATFTTLTWTQSVLLLWAWLIQIRSNVNTASSCYPFLLVLIVLNYSSTQRFTLNPGLMPYQTHIPYTIFAYLNPSAQHEKIRRRNCFSGCIPWHLGLFVHTFVLFELCQ